MLDVREEIAVRRECARSIAGVSLVAAYAIRPVAAFAQSATQAATTTVAPATAAVTSASTQDSPLAIILAGVAGAFIGGVFTLIATRMTSRSSRSLERHKFRYEIGRMAAEKRLQAYIDLASLACAAYRKRFSCDWATGEWKDTCHTFFNYYYDNRFFFSQRLGEAFGTLRQSLNVEYPKREIVEQHLNVFFDTVSADLLLSDLEESARRAVKAAVSLPD